MVYFKYFPTFEYEATETNFTIPTSLQQDSVNF